MRETVTIKARENAYEAVIEEGLLERIPRMLADSFPGSRFAVITDENVFRLYGERFKNALETAGAGYGFIIVSPGERSKSLSVLSEVLSGLARDGFTRSDVVIAFGGGVVGDLAGFAASCYLRGVRYAQIPTTLLAQIDSSIGGKTGVNLPEGKNLAGAYHHPRAVYADTALLKTLSADDFSGGMAEMIKYALIKDKEMLAVLEDNVIGACSPMLGGLIKRCVEIKRDIVAADERDSGERMLLNFGHTVGHALERICAKKGEPMTHGQAVARGMAFVTAVGEARGLTAKGASGRVGRLLEKYGLPAGLEGFGAREVMEGIFVDKKNLSGALNLVLLKEPGEAFLYPLPAGEAQEFIFGVK